MQHNNANAIRRLVARLTLAMIVCALPGARAQESQPGAGAPPADPLGSMKIPEMSDSDVQIFAGLMDPFVYEARGRRDPFAIPIEDRPMSQGNMHGPVLPLQKYELDRLSLVGILWDVRKPKALLADPDRNTHIVGLNAKIGPRNGYVAAIREGEIVVVETIEQDGRLISTSQIMKIRK